MSQSNHPRVQVEAATHLRPAGFGRAKPGLAPPTLGPKALNAEAMRSLLSPSSAGVDAGADAALVALAVEDVRPGIGRPKPGPAGAPNTGGVVGVVGEPDAEPVAPNAGDPNLPGRDAGIGSELECCGARGAAENADDDGPLGLPAASRIADSAKSDLSLVSSLPAICMPTLSIASC